MDATTVAIDLAKDVFEVAIGNRAGQVLHRYRFTRARLQRFLEGQAAGTEVLMEACGTAHHWGRLCQRLQLVPVLLPVQYVRAYVRRNKSDRTDAAALLEARRCGEIAPVPVKTPEQQAWQGLHRIRQQWQKTRTARINGLRGLLREYGIVVGLGARRLHAHVPAIVTTEEAPVPGPLLAALQTLLEEIRSMRRWSRTWPPTTSGSGCKRFRAWARLPRVPCSPACRTSINSGGGASLPAGSGSRPAKPRAAIASGAGASPNAGMCTYAPCSFTARGA